MAENQQLLVTFVLPYSEIIVAIYNTLYGVCQIRSLDVSNKKQQKFGLNFAERHLYHSIFFYTSLRIKWKPVLKNVSISGWVVIGHVGVESVFIVSLVMHHPLFLSRL